MNNPSANHRGHILIADDEALVRDSVASLLRSRGFTCTCVASGDEVLELLGSQEFDALISDLQMPGNCGLSLFERIAQLAAGLPVILLTGKPTIETAARSLRLPVVAYLTKPPDFEELIRILDESILELRAFRAMQAGRRHLLDWERELQLVLQQQRTAGSLPEGPMTHYLRLTLRHVILVLSELEQATRALEGGSGDHQTLQLLDREAALRRAVDVLRRTKQNFKSKELGELRQELERLLTRGDGPDDHGAAGAS